MKLLKIIFLALGALFTVAGILTVIEGFKFNNDAAASIGYFIGAFLPSTVCFALARVFHRRQKRKALEKETKALLESLPQ